MGTSMTCNPIISGISPKGLCTIKINKAGYTDTPVASGWAGAIFDVDRAFGHEQLAKYRKNIKKQSKMDGPMDRQTDGRTDKTKC